MYISTFILGNTILVYSLLLCLKGKLVADKLCFGAASFPGFTLVLRPK